MSARVGGERSEPGGRRILLLSQYFEPETVGVAKRATELAVDLARYGDAVTVVTGFPNHPSTVNRDAESLRVDPTEDRGGLRIHRIPVFASPSKNVIHRVRNYTSFMVSALRYLRRLDQPFDAVVAISPPLSAATAGAIFARMRRRPCLVDVCDVWPDAGVALGALKSRPLIWLLGRMERITYRLCRHITVVSPAYVPNLRRKGVPESKMTVIRDWANTDVFWADRYAAERGSMRAAFGLEDRFVVLYTGNIGLAQGLDAVVEAADLLARSSDPDANKVAIVLLGEGVAKDDLTARAKELGLSNLLFLPGVRRDDVPHYHAMADALLAAYAPSEYLEMAIPSKVYEYFSSGRPVIAAASGELRRLVETSDCGLPATPGDAAGLAEVIVRLAKDGELQRELAGKGRATALERFSRASATREFRSAIETMCAQTEAR